MRLYLILVKNVARFVATILFDFAPNYVRVRNGEAQSVRGGLRGVVDGVKSVLDCQRQPWKAGDVGGGGRWLWGESPHLCWQAVDVRVGNGEAQSIRGELRGVVDGVKSVLDCQRQPWRAGDVGGGG